jgi:hypothetical protein
MAAESPETIERFFQMGTTAAERLLATISEFRPSDSDDFAYKGAMLAFFAKGYRSYQAIRILFNQGLGEDAVSILRTMFDLLLQAVWVHQSPTPRGRSFLLHERVAQYLLYERLKRTGDDPAMVNYLESQADDLAQLKADFDRLKADYASTGNKVRTKGKKPRVQQMKVGIHEHWWCGSVADLARWLGSVYQKQYATLYPVMSGFVHSDVHSFGGFFRKDPEGWLVNCRPSEPTGLAAAAPMFATSWLLELARALDAAFAAGLDDYLKREGEELNRLALDGAE